ncbi:MAG: hypothetical protein OWV35_12530, partial [Firmicutes bacterium]|nr:hypothetical protein [Bacillota bacterium]
EREAGEVVAAAARWLAEGPVAVLTGGELTVEEAAALTDAARRLWGAGAPVLVRTGRGYLPPALHGTLQDLQTADAVLLLGADPYQSVPVGYLAVREAYRRGAGIWGLAPRRLGRRALPVQEHVTAPGEEAAVLARALAAAGVGGAAALLQDLGDWQPAAGTGDLEALGRALLGAARLAVIWDGEEAGVEDVLLALAAARGEAPTRVLPAWGPAGWRGQELAGVRVTAAALEGVLRAAAAGEVGTLVLWGTDLLREAPDPELAARALAGAGHVLAAGAFLSPATRADAWLPLPVRTEHGGTFADWEGTLTAVRAAVPPQPGVRTTGAWLEALAAAAGRRWAPPADPLAGRMTGSRLRLLPDVPAPAPRPLRRPEAAGAGVTVLRGGDAYRGGPPSAIFLRPPTAGAIAAEDAVRLDRPAGGPVRIRGTTGELVLPLAADPALPAGRVWLPYDLPEAAGGLPAGPWELAPAAEAAEEVDGR